jgi:hypothetical protein
MTVNYHAIGEYVIGGGGQFLRTSHARSDLNIVACLLGSPSGGFIETRQAYHEAIEHLGPDDFFCLKVGFQNHHAGFTTEQLIATLRLVGWDHNIFLGCFAALLEQAHTATGPLRDELRVLVRNVWQSYFVVVEPNDLAFHLGLLLSALRCFEGSSGFAVGRNPTVAS